MRKLGIRLRQLQKPVLGPEAVVLVDVETGEEIGGVRDISLSYPVADAVTATITLLVDRLTCTNEPIR